MGTLALVGGQYGSEGKGVIASKLAAGATLAVRTGGPNAGHSIFHEGRVWKMRSIPCAWINPQTILIIGPGAVIDAELLIKEVDNLEAAGYSIRPRLFVDPAATLISEADRFLEDEIVKQIGSTGEGVGEARERKIDRRIEFWEWPKDILEPHMIHVSPTIAITNTHALTGAVMLEGTQGYGLSLHHGHYPFVTSANCTAAQLASDAGLGIVPLISDWATMVVFRSFPIRVGGPSGPMKDEITWDEISRRVGKPTTEVTTVTGRTRRIAKFDWELAKEAIMVNGATSQVLTFADYIDPAVTGVTRLSQLTKMVRAFIDKLEDAHGVPVIFVGTGGPEWSVVDLSADKALRSGSTGKRQDNYIKALS